MFENLTEKFQRVYKNLRGEGKLTEEHINLAMGEIRTALLEADVNVKVAQQFIDRVRAKAVGAEVMTSLSPAQQVVKVVRDEMVELLGGQAVKLRFKSQPPSVILMAGLQGSGKTTTSAKLAYWLSRNGHRPQLVSVDVYRPAAREQLKIMAATAGMPVFEGPPGENSPYELARLARREAIMSGRDTVIVDTAGRLHIDEDLMGEMKKLREQLDPTEILFVADAMIGQDAVNSASEFHSKLGLTGIILTKMDGDARGGAAISIRQVTGQPLKFIGLGEKFDAFEVFHPDRVAGRILGMGDVLSLVEKAEQAMDQRKARELEKRMFAADFSLDDFREQLRQVRKMGPMESVLAMLPQVGPLQGLSKAKVDEKELTKTEAIINSMTDKERNNHQIINGSRRKRIAMGSGTSVQEVNRLLKQYVQAKKMMKTFSSGFMGKKLAKMRLEEMLTGQE
jgi:signal recognition particle subunit SRP54